MDSQALDLLSSRQVLCVTLRRKVTSSAHRYGEFYSPWIPQKEILTEPAEDIATAVWWRRPNDAVNVADHPAASRTRELDGEILLSRSLKPTFHISHFGIEVSQSSLDGDSKLIKADYHR